MNPSAASYLLIYGHTAYVARNIKKGESFTEENLTVKRPGNGISPMRWDEILGQVTQKKYEKDELI